MKKIAGYLLGIGFVTQIIMGIIWVIGNLKFYTGFEVLQLGIAFFAAVYLLCSIMAMTDGSARIDLRVWFGALTIISFPHVLHTAISNGYSLILAGTLVIIAIFIEAVRLREQLPAWKLVSMLVIWGIMPFASLIYFVALSIPVIIGICLSGKNRVIKISGALVVSAIAVAVIFEVIFSTYYFQEALISRNLLPNPVNDRYFWDDDLKEAVSYEQLFILSGQPEDFGHQLLAAFLENTDEDKVWDITFQVANIGWLSRRKFTIHNLAYDLLGHTCAPIISAKQLGGDTYSSKTGINLDKFRENMPVFGSLFFRFYSSLFSVYIGLACLIALTDLKRVWKDFKNYWVVFSTLALIIMTLAFNGAGAFDYKKSIASTVMFLVFELVWCYRGIGNKE